MGEENSYRKHHIRIHLLLGSMLIIIISMVWYGFRSLSVTLAEEQVKQSKNSSQIQRLPDAAATKTPTFTGQLRDWDFAMFAQGLGEKHERNNHPSRVAVASAKDKADEGQRWLLEAESPGYRIMVRGDVPMELDLFNTGTQLVFSPGEHVLASTVIFSDKQCPLVLMVRTTVSDCWLCYAGGRAKVKLEGNDFCELGRNHNVGLLIDLLNSKDLRRQIGGAWELGWLPQNDAEKQQAKNALWSKMNDANDSLKTVIFESLTRIGNKTDLEKLKGMKHPDKSPMTYDKGSLVPEQA